jgi:toxin ParE1/3/4
MKIVYTPKAQADLDGIVDYYKPLNPYALAKIYAEVAGAIALIAQFPRAGRQQKPKKVRKVVVRKYKYLIYYTCDEDERQISILTIRHSARRRPYSDR